MTEVIEEERGEDDGVPGDANGPPAEVPLELTAADLDLGLQSKLLHFLQDGFFSRLGDQGERSVLTRVICATGRSLEDEIVAGRFRADLYYRINVLKIAMPRLADRREDIPQLVEYLRRVHSRHR